MAFCKENSPIDLSTKSVKTETTNSRKTRFVMKRKDNSDKDKFSHLTL